MAGLGRRALRRIAPCLVGLCVLSALVLARTALPDPFERMRLAVFDLIQRAAPRAVADADSPVRVIDIDDESLRRYGQWPWPRTVVASLIGNLQDLGAAAIALDIVFAEPDRTSPAGLAAEWRAAYGWTAGTKGAPLPDHDRILAETFARGRVVTGYGLLPGGNGAATVAGPSFALIGADPAATVHGFGSAIPNIPVLEAAAAGHGSFTIAAGRDEIVRRLPLLSALGGRLVPALSVEALRVAQGEGTLKVRGEGAEAGYLLRVGAVDVPLAPDGTLWLHHSGSVQSRTIPAWRLLEPDRGAALGDVLAGRIALVGTSAVGLSDLRPTPLNAYEPGVAIHAEALEQMLAGHFLSRPAWLAGAEIVASLALALALVVAATFAPLRFAAGLALATLAMVAAASWFGFTRGHALIDPSFALIAATAGFGAATLTRHLLVERDALRLRTAFTHYLSPDLVAALARDPDRLRLGGETREMTFLFTDLQGFTSLTEARGAESLVALLNLYLDGLCAVAMEHGGTVDKIVGDAVHVMFNAPLDQPDHAARAVRCALAMDAFAVIFAAGQGARGVPFGATRIGVNTGPAVVGNFGGARRFNYTAHGDAINTAARLEAANKALGTRICVARATVESCPDLAFRPVGTLMLRGKAQGVEVFEPLSPDPAGAAFAARYRDAFARIVAGDETGAADLLRLHAERPDDPILALHARRIGAGERGARIAA